MRLKDNKYRKKERVEAWASEREREKFETNYIVRHVVDRCYSRHFGSVCWVWIFRSNRMASMNGRKILIRSNHFHSQSWLLTSHRDKHMHSSSIVATQPTANEKKYLQQALLKIEKKKKWFLNVEIQSVCLYVFHLDFEFNFTPINRRSNMIWLRERKNYSNNNNNDVKN